jgi:hypothetical protein
MRRALVHIVPSKILQRKLEEKPDLPSLEILRRVREAGYQGGKTALYALVASVRPKEIKPRFVSKVCPENLANMTSEK